MPTVEPRLGREVEDIEVFVTRRNTLDGRLFRVGNLDVGLRFSHEQGELMRRGEHMDEGNSR